MLAPSHPNLLALVADREPADAKSKMLGPESVGPTKPSHDDPETVEADLFSAAVQAFERGDHDEAIELFQRLYALTDKVNVLYNIARVYEEKGDLPRAVEYYQRFVGQPGVEIGARKDALERIEVLRAAAEEFASRPIGPEVSREAGVKKSAASSERHPQIGADAQSEATRKQRARRIAGHSLLGAGGGVLVIGAVLGGLALRGKREAEDAEFVEDAIRLREDARTWARAADAMYITGGIIAATGIVLELTALPPRKKARTRSAVHGSTAWAPWWNGKQVGVAILGRF